VIIHFASFFLNPSVVFPFFKKCIQALKRNGDCTIHTDFKTAGIFSFAQMHVMNVNLLFLSLLFLLMLMQIEV